MTGIILAGGQSIRMGKDKASLPWSDSDLLNAKIYQLRSIFTDIIVVSNTPRKIDADIRVVTDIYPKMGPLGGIHAGLIAARNPYAFVTACDMPYFSANAVRYLCSNAEQWDITMPVHGEQYYEPLFACYSKACIGAAEMLFEKNIRRIIDLFNLVRYKLISQEDFRAFDPQLNIFSNINTALDYQKALLERPVPNNKEKS
ncbi:molybdenum cofactor guanylyltransferase [Dendrosporobacter sp. 1207_IL3150]|uniref:molybdenum cofactor guanylyltransferase n=1 Tax=Dendrosporobacter sp. 1207_IL3150 TaxID=3084054 RepID=UPI002FDB047C